MTDGSETGMENVPINLIPAARRERRQRRRWQAVCAVSCMGYALVVSAVSLGARTVIGQSDANLPENLETAAADADRAASDLARLKADLDAADALLRSSRAIAEQPDWSALLGVLAARAGDAVILKAVSVREEDPPAPVANRPAGRGPANKPVAPPRPPAVLVNVLGAGPTQSAASQFALRLESSGLFSKVSLLDTSRETYADLPLVSFRVECVLSAEPKSKPAGQATATLGGDR